MLLHRRQPTRLPCPWDSPGRNTGVGCHYLLQCMKVKSEREVAQSCLTISDPMDCSPPTTWYIEEYGLSGILGRWWGNIFCGECGATQSLSHSSQRKLSKLPRFRSCTDSVLTVKNLLEIMASVWLMYMGLLLFPYYFESCSKIDFFFNQRRQQGSERWRDLHSVTRVTAQSLLLSPGMVVLESKLILPGHHSLLWQVCMWSWVIPFPWRMIMA